MIRIQREPIDTSDLFDIISPETGAFVLFAGTVRADGMDHLVFDVDIEEAEKELGHIIDEANTRWGPVQSRVTHRYGEMHIGEVIVLITVAAGHRDQAFAVARYIIDELKIRVPIWKADVTSGTISWIHGEKE